MEYIILVGDLLMQVMIPYQPSTGEPTMAMRYLMSSGEWVERKEVSEITVQRKSSGILSAVCTCHFVFAIQMLYSS